MRSQEVDNQISLHPESALTLGVIQHRTSAPCDGWQLEVEVRLRCHSLTLDLTGVLA